MLFLLGLPLRLEDSKLYTKLIYSSKLNEPLSLRAFVAKNHLKGADSKLQYNIWNYFFADRGIPDFYGTTIISFVILPKIKVNMKKILAIAFLLAILFSCKDEFTTIKTKGLIPRKDFVEILAAIHLADVLTSGPNFTRKFEAGDTLEINELILKKYNVTNAQFDSTVATYIHQPDVYMKVYDEVLLKLNYMLDTLKKNTPKFSKEGIEE
jgi:hypothetical protein